MLIFQGVWLQIKTTDMSKKASLQDGRRAARYEWSDMRPL